MISPSAIERYDATANELVQYYEENLARLKNFQNSVQGYFQNSNEFQKIIHSTKTRLKSRQSLKDKLLRKASDAIANGKEFSIGKENLFEKVNDLVGFRFLHIYTRQFVSIDEIIKRIISEEELILIEGPIAKIWDVENSDYFKSIGIATEESKSMYTSVHYVIGSGSKFNVTCEIQVRTLSDEVWGEVDHDINYPHPTASIPCAEQIRALARVTSATTRLVDSIYATVAVEKKA